MSRGAEAEVAMAPQCVWRGVESRERKNPITVTGHVHAGTRVGLAAWMGVERVAMASVTDCGDMVAGRREGGG